MSEDASATGEGRDADEGRDGGERPATGGCLCGAVRYKVSGELRPIAYCHCSQCRIQTGLAVAATQVAAHGFSMSGEVRWYGASAEAERGFCPACGTLLFWRRHRADAVSIMAGSLDDQSRLAADRHIFVADKPDWHAVSDGLPRYAASSRDAEPLAD